MTRSAQQRRVVLETILRLNVHRRNWSTACAKQKKSRPFRGGLFVGSHARCAGYLAIR
jgi:hypothetical protein